MAGQSPAPHDATAAYESAVGAAREQNAKLLELRAATRLAAHQRRIGETSTVLNQLAALCDWFAPTADLPDLIRARSLLTPESPTR